MRFEGTLKSWNDERGFGFIAPLQGGQDIFVHIKAFPPGTGRPAIGLGLRFDVDIGPNGKKRAKDVAFIRAPGASRRARSGSPAPWTWPRLIVVPAFAVLVAVVAFHWKVQPVVGLVYLVASVAAFIAYGLDKSAARGDRWRTPEDTLHLFGLACGWPGALLAQQWMRHKTSKASFVQTYWITVGMNMAGFVALHSPWVQARLPW